MLVDCIGDVLRALISSLGNHGGVTLSEEALMAQILCLAAYGGISAEVLFSSCSGAITPLVEFINAHANETFQAKLILYVAKLTNFSFGLTVGPNSRPITVSTNVTKTVIQFLDVDKYI